MIPKSTQNCIDELKKENDILEINMSVLGDDEGNISQNENLIDILTEIYED